ncbi:aromatic amino acid transporter [Vibrio nereis]|uniref:Aromatic amino acid transporter n=2 Tax=Vibrio nereis TaxID=693 RepID=A0A0M0HMN8_VIBNE|nr:aromatic amino acid transporter [Vibrio nereis]
MGFARNVTELLGPVGGAASIYTVASVFLVLVMGVPKVKNYPPRYVVICGGLFVAYEICLALALGMANSRQQAIEMLVINYLWPALTVLLAVIVSNKKTNFLVYPSIVIAFLGVAWSITGDQSLSLAQIAANVATNPTTYAMAFVGAFLWAIYCNLTKRISDGQNGITLFFIMTAVTLWIKYALSNETGMTLTWEASGLLLISGVAMGSGYALWNFAILGGNMVLLATLSYFTPVLSTILSSFILGLSLTQSFLEGVVMVTIGSLMCWWVTRDNS